MEGLTTPRGQKPKSGSGGANNKWKRNCALALIIAAFTLTPAGTRTATQHKNVHLVGKSSSKGKTPSQTAAPQHPLTNESLTFLESRKQVYENVGIGRNWHLRGIAYLYEHQQILLAGQYLTEQKNGGQTQHYIRIDNVYPHRTKTAASDSSECEKLFMWIRVTGTEIFAGKPRAVPGQPCHWRFDFDLQIAGEYHVDAKVLMWNPSRELTQTCTAQEGTVPTEIVHSYPQHGGFKGFKMYDAAATCCEACTRQRDPPCRYWSTHPDKLPNAARHVHNGCELYFDRNVTQLPFASHILGDLPNVQWSMDGYSHRRRLLGNENHHNHNPSARYHGYPYTQDATAVEYFVGCGWHTMFTLDFPCLSGTLDDMVYMKQKSFLVQEQEIHHAAIQSQTQMTQLPWCNLKSEISSVLTNLDFNSQKAQLSGRWVQEPWPNATDCPEPFAFDESFQRFQMIQYNGSVSHPHCWHRDNLFKIGFSQCLESNCRWIRPGSKFQSSSVSYFRKKQWMGVWRRYDCDYMEYTDSQLQQCVDALQISKFETDGRSIAQYLGEYLQQRTQNLQLFQGSNGRKVTLSTLGLLHNMDRFKGDFDQWLQSQPTLSFDKNNSKEIVFVVGGYFLSSQRAVFAQAHNVDYANQKIQQQLLPKGYRYLNAYDLSIAMAYVTTQQDGMHLIGPTCKMVITKMLHHLCKDVVQGSKV
mmetsp:Transcript_15140/g.31211  ORF Transcript_15140/g.31211 Transcript_15140/m.31211 type:complete len:697 (-) Transcript_15140:1269-3359(-)